MARSSSVATWLNFLAGNNIGAASDTNSPKHFLDDAIDWFQKFAGKDNDITNTDAFDVLDIKASNNMTSAGWLTKIDGTHDGSAMHNALDGYNNDGTINGVFYSCDADSELAMLAMSQVG